MACARMRSPQIQELLEQARGMIAIAAPKEKLERLGDAAFVLGQLAGGGSITRDEARALALELAQVTKFPVDTVGDVIGLSIAEGMRKPRGLGK